MTGAASALFLLDIKGRVLVWRDYRGDVSAVQAERFFSKLIEKEVGFFLFGEMNEVKPLIWVEAQVERHSRSCIEIMLKARSQFKERSYALQLMLKLSHLCHWMLPIPMFVLQWDLLLMEYMLRAEFRLPSITSEEAVPERKAPIQVKFDTVFHRFRIQGIQPGDMLFGSCSKCLLIRPEDGRSLKPICLLQLCRIGVILYGWFDISLLKNYYNFGFDHFNTSWKKMGIWGLVSCLMGKGGPFAYGDWILPDVTIQGSIRSNTHIQTFPDTYYFSYTTKRTRKVMRLTVPSGLLRIHPLLLIRVLQTSQWRHPTDVSQPYKGCQDEDWWDNDGALNTVSMTHPRLPVEHPSHLVIKDSECQPLQPGIWYYKIVEGDHILFIVNRERAGEQFDLIYDSILERCRKHAFRKTPTMPNQINQ